MTIRDGDGYVITPALVLAAYRARCFPMAEERHGSVDWFRPCRRAVLTWDRWRVPRSMRKRWRQQPYRLTIDRAFPAVIAACADRPQTWISTGIETVYNQLHATGHAQSCEAWDADGALVGGLYGLRVGGCFCGESMFHLSKDASKLCLMYLVAVLRINGFALLDCQQQSPHMQAFGAYEIDDERYATLLAACQDDDCRLREIPPATDIAW